MWQKNGVLSFECCNLLIKLDGSLQSGLIHSSAVRAGSTETLPNHFVFAQSFHFQANDREHA